MLKCGLARGAIEQKMRADGVDPTLLGGLNDGAASAAAPAPAAAAPSPAAAGGGGSSSGDPRLVKYEKMLKIGLARGAVEQKLRAVRSSRN